MQFKEYDCYAVKMYYSNGNTAIQLHSKKDGGTVAKATVNLEDELVEELAYIKDYSENEGMLEALQSAGIVKEIIRNNDFEAPLCRLNLDKLLTYKQYKEIGGIEWIKKQ